ncbi:hypothetical protein ACTNE2_11115 [Bacillota bacterium HCP3S3_F1_2]
MKQSLKEAYQAERERAIVTLYNTVRRFREQLDLEAERECCLDTESAAFTQAYISAQLALLQLMKEESEENDHE